MATKKELGYQITRINTYMKGTIAEEFNYQLSYAYGGVKLVKANKETGGEMGISYRSTLKEMTDTLYAIENVFLDIMKKTRYK